MAEGMMQKPFAVNLMSFSPGIASSEGAQIPTSYLDQTFMLITIRRYGYYDSLVLPTTLIVSGLTAAGTIRKYGNNDIRIKISENGLITVSGTSAEQLIVDVYAFG